MNKSISDTTINVDINGLGDFTSIQDALDSLPDMIIHRYDIKVADGVYNEDVIVPPVAVPRFHNQGNVSKRGQLIIEGNMSNPSAVKVKSFAVGGGLSGEIPIRGFEITGSGHPSSDGGGKRAFEVGAGAHVIAQSLKFSGVSGACFSAFGGHITDKGNIEVTGTYDYYAVQKRQGLFLGAYTPTKIVTGHISRCLFWTQEPHLIMGYERSGMQLTFGENLTKSSGFVNSYDHSDTADVYYSGAHANGIVQYNGAVPPEPEPEPEPDVNAQDIIDAMPLTPDATRQDHIETLVANLKTAGVWDKLKVFGVFAAHDKQAGLVNWKDPSTNFTEVGLLDVVTDEGFLCDDGSYVETGKNLSDLITQTNGHIASYSLTDIAKGHTDIGSSDSFETYINPMNGNNNFQARINMSSNISSTSMTDSLGLTVITRNNNNVTAYRKGSQIVSQSHAGLTVDPGTLRVCGGVNGNIDGFRRIAAFSAGECLTATEVADFNSALETYLTSIGSI